jgi:hypothetical protein
MKGPSSQWISKTEEIAVVNLSHSTFLGSILVEVVTRRLPELFKFQGALKQHLLLVARLVTRHARQVDMLHNRATRVDQANGRGRRNNFGGTPIPRPRGTVCCMQGAGER